MASCKDCIHYIVCMFGDDTEYKDFEALKDDCHYFTNKADVIEVTNDPIIYVKDNWLVLNMESKDLGEAIKRIIDCANR